MRDERATLYVSLDFCVLQRETLLWRRVVRCLRGGFELSLTAPEERKMSNDMIDLKTTEDKKNCVRASSFSCPLQRADAHCPPAAAVQRKREQQRAALKMPHGGGGGRKAMSAPVLSQTLSIS